MRTTTQWIAIAGLAFGTFACEEKTNTEAQPAEKPAELAQKPAPKAEVKPASVKQEAAPAVDTSWQLTDARRSAIESAIVDAKGFLDAQQQLSMSKPADSAAALKALDTSAKGKWLLLIGSVSKVSDKGLEVSLSTSDSAAPSSAEPAAAPAANPPSADKAAVEGSKPSAAAPASSVVITVSKIDGFKKDAYQVDQKVVVLAQYAGAGQAQPAYDVMAMGKWQPSAADPTAAAGTQPAQGAAEQAAPGSKPAAPAAATKPEGKY
jgi:hypothetical protein